MKDFRNRISNLSFKTRILVIFSVIIALFTVLLIFFEQDQLKRERTRSIEMSLENNADIVYNYLKSNGVDVSRGVDSEGLRDIVSFMPRNQRLTIIDWTGKVLFDNTMNPEEMENHLQRPEIQRTIAMGSGRNIRRSSSTGIEYLYYAKKYDEGLFIRMALPYDVGVRSFINAENSFVFFIVLFFVISVLMMLYFMDRFSRSIRELREFSFRLNKGMPITKDFVFADDEVGEVSKAIVENYNLLKENEKKLVGEREKLLMHFQYSEEGIAIFTERRTSIYSNSHFLQYLNMILEEPTLEVDQLFGSKEFAGVVKFLDGKGDDGNIYSERFEKSGRQLALRVIIFDDKSFEIYINDITKQEKTRLLKQEMTNNIAHELRTPVTSIRGYMETILGMFEDVEAFENRDKIVNFVGRAYAQTIHLSELIQDISTLTKIEEAGDMFEREVVNMNELLNNLKMDVENKLSERGDEFEVAVDESVEVFGIKSLLYSIFRNLVDNSIAYAGDGVKMVVSCYSENDDTYFFEFYDNGCGVEEKHLVRLFERFYRVNEGRTRNSGGSGLGLSIVRNAVHLHKGSIVAKNKSGGGLSFLITLPKE